MDTIPTNGDVQTAERSQRSFATLNNLLHSFTAGKSNKKPVTKAPQLTDAEVQKAAIHIILAILTLQCGRAVRLATIAADCQYPLHIKIRFCWQCAAHSSPQSYLRLLHCDSSADWLEIVAQVL